MTALLYALGVLAFALVIVVSIGLHEIGHMVPAKRFGGKVTQYFIGFGPTVWSKQVGETEYGVKAIPLGGYVKIVGMLPPGTDLVDEVEKDADGNDVITVRRSSTGVFSQLVSDARAAEWEHIRPEDSDRLFYRMPWWRKVVVMAGGPTMNLLIAFGVFWLLFATFGQVVRVDVSPAVSEVLPCVVPAAEDGRECSAAEIRDNPTPAYAAGLQVGDEFVSFNGTSITGWEQLQKLIRGNGDKPATFGIKRDGQVLEKTIATTVQARPTLDDPTSTKLEKVGFLGVVPKVPRSSSTAARSTRCSRWDT
ncbi:MAG: site-2 protease family protein [Nocardioides sp.]